MNLEFGIQENLQTEIAHLFVDITNCNFPKYSVHLTV
jgi:hypothetical protein